MAELGPRPLISSPEPFHLPFSFSNLVSIVAVTYNCIRTRKVTSNLSFSVLILNSLDPTIRIYLRNMNI